MIKSRFAKSVLFSLVIFGGIWVLFNRDKISEPGDVVQLIQQKLSATVVGFRSRIGNATVDASDPLGSDSTQFVNGVVRVGSFRITEPTTVASSNQTIDLIAELCRQYDAIALQLIGAHDADWLSRLTDRMNEMGAVGTMHVSSNPGEKKGDYYFISEPVSSLGHDTRLAIVFNRRTLDLDQSTTYVVQDPDNILSHSPLVGCFRARGPAPHLAFTFTLVNIKLHSKRPDLELVYLGELYRAIRDDGRSEDDVIIAGDFNSGDRGLEPLKKQAGLSWAISNRPTNVQKTMQFDNLIFGESSTVEFTGRSGVADFMRQYNLRLEDALRISDRMPVWAEFSVMEGEQRAGEQREGEQRSNGEPRN